MEINKISGVDNKYRLAPAPSDDLFDMNFEISNMGPGIDSNVQITSKFACTPGCGHTGTGNSFCCTCK